MVSLDNLSDMSDDTFNLHFFLHLSKSPIILNIFVINNLNHL